MSQPSPLATPLPWNAVAEGYASEFLPIFSLYAQSAIELAELTADAEVLDVATGPGTLALQAAKLAQRVTALDFAESMVAIIEQRVQQAGLGNVIVQAGDGQALPFSDASFDRAFSMFGLMFFPDRSRGFSELHRVLRPGGRAVVSSWAPVERAPLLAAMFACLGSMIPELAFGQGKAPLADENDFEHEMAAAGFGSVKIHTVEHPVEIASIEDFWQAQTKASAPIVIVKGRIDEVRWQELSAQVVDKLRLEFGSGPLRLTWPAFLGVGSR